MCGSHAGISKVERSRSLNLRGGAKYRFADIGEPIGEGIGLGIEAYVNWAEDVTKYLKMY